MNLHVVFIAICIMNSFSSILIVSENGTTITHINTDARGTVQQLFDSIQYQLINHHNYSQLCEFEFFHSGSLIKTLKGYYGEMTRLHELSIYPDQYPEIMVKTTNNFPLIMNNCEFKRQHRTRWTPGNSIITNILYANNLEIEFYFHINAQIIPKIFDVLNIDNHIQHALSRETIKSVRIGYYYGVFQIRREMSIKSGIEGLKPENNRIDTTEIPMQYMGATNHVYIKFTNREKLIIVNNYEINQDGDFRIFGQNRVCLVYFGVSRLHATNDDNESLFGDLEMEEQQDTTSVSFNHLCINTNVREFEFMDDKLVDNLVEQLIRNERKHSRHRCCSVQ
eukprot:194620_1